MLSRQAEAALAASKVERMAPNLAERGKHDLPLVSKFACELPNRKCACQDYIGIKRYVAPLQNISVNKEPAEMWREALYLPNLKFSFNSSYFIIY